MPHDKRIIKKSSGSKGRLRPASETGKRGQPLQRSARSMPHGGESALVIAGPLTAAERKEILALVEAEGHRETRRDAKKTIDLIEERIDGITVYVSDSHLALALGKKLHRSRKGGELTITWSHEDKPVRVHWAKRRA